MKHNQARALICYGALGVVELWASSPTLLSDAHGSRSEGFRRGQKPARLLGPPQRSHRSSRRCQLRRVLERTRGGALAETAQRALLR